LLLCSAAQAAPLTTGADFLLFTTGARPDGMGQAFAAVADDVNTLSFNPAGLGNIRLPEVGYGYVNFPGDVTFQFLGAAIPLGPAGVLGLGYLSMGTAPFDSTGGGGPLVSIQEQAFTAGWGLSLYDLHLGASAKYVRRDLDGILGQGFGLDLGLRLRLDPTWTLAASALNLGPGIAFEGASPEPLPTALHLATALALVEEEGHKLDLAVDLGWNTVTNTQTLGVGAEYLVQGAVFLRAGYFGWSQDDQIHLDGLSAGAGVRVEFLQLDYAYQPFNEIGAIHRFSGLLRWDGPWMKGVEPNAPRHVKTSSTARGLMVRWEKPQGPSSAFEVTLEPLDGRPVLRSPRVTTSYHLFRDLEPGSLFKVSVRTLGEGGTKSFPSVDTLIRVRLPRSGEGKGDMRVNWSGKGFGTVEGGGGLLGELDGVGLKLSWERVPGAKGYHLYRQDRAGRMERATISPRASGPLWLTEASSGGFTWVVTALLEGDKERVVGSLPWDPSSAVRAALVKDAQLVLKASAQSESRVFLDWGRLPSASGYSLFLSREPDGVLEFAKDYGPDQVTDLLKMDRGRGPKVYFLVAPKATGGSYLGRSNISGASLFF